jgi:hypothetical protein
VADGRPEVEVRGHGSQPRQNLGPAKTTVAPRARYDIDGPIRRGRRGLLLKRPKSTFTSEKVKIPDKYNHSLPVYFAPNLLFSACLYSPDSDSI